MYYDSIKKKSIINRKSQRGEDKKEWLVTEIRQTGWMWCMHMSQNKHTKYCMYCIVHTCKTTHTLLHSQPHSRPLKQTNIYLLLQILRTLRKQFQWIIIRTHTIELLNKRLLPSPTKESLNSYHLLSIQFFAYDM